MISYLHCIALTENECINLMQFNTSQLCCLVENYTLFSEYAIRLIMRNHFDVYSPIQFRE